MGSEIEMTVNAMVIREQWHACRIITDAEIRYNGAEGLNVVIELSREDELQSRVKRSATYK